MERDGEPGRDSGRDDVCETLPLRVSLPRAMRRLGTDLFRCSVGAEGVEAEVESDRARLEGKEEGGLEVDFLRGLAALSVMSQVTDMRSLPLDVRLPARRPNYGRDPGTRR